MKKSTLLMVLSLVLALALGVGGTMAYLQDTDADVNVMTLGNVYIEQLEFERITQTNSGKDELQEFTNNEKPLYPAVGEIAWAEDENGRVYQQWPTGGSSALFDTEKLNNEVDKFVHVKNTGKSDAYFRTIFGFELADGWTVADVKDDKMIHLNINDADGNGGGHYKWTWADDVLVLEDGSRFAVATATYVGKGDTHKDGILPAGETSRPSLLQIFLDKSATNEDIASLGENYEILVVSQAVQTVGFENVGADVALNTAFNEGKLLNSEAGLALTAEWFGKAIEKYEAEEQAKLVDHWDGTVDTGWYNDTDTEFVLNTAEELAGLAELVDEGNTFEGKTVKLGTDLCLGCDNEDCCTDENGEVTSFNPIGSYRFEKSFMGTFDGQNNTIYKLTQTTWALDNGYYYNDCGLGLFGAVEDGTVKNLVIDGANISGESAICGTVAAVAEDATFENITVKNSNVADYQYYAGGIVGWAGGEMNFVECDVEASTTVGSQWGDFNNANGGVIGGISTQATILMKDCTVACRIDVPNDVVSAYEWYSYRRSGMLIGDSGQTETDEAVTTAAAPNLICENVTVTYGDWANYTYCQFNAMNYPWVRVQEGISVGAYSNVRYGNPTDANGNTVVDDNHVHNEGEEHQKLIVFDQLYGGETGDRYCTYGKETHDGVTVVYNNK